MPPSSRGLGQLPFTEQTGIRIPLGVLYSQNLIFFILVYTYSLSNYSLLLSFKILVTINKKNLYKFMLKIIWVVLSISLIGLIFLRTPQNQGIASFSTKSNLLGSPSSAEQFLNNLTIILMIGYFSFAIFLNFLN